MQPKKHYFAHIPTIAIFIVFAMSAPLGVLLFILKSIDKNAEKEETAAAQAQADYRSDPGIALQQHGTRQEQDPEAACGTDRPTAEQKSAQNWHKTIAVICTILGAVFLFTGAEELIDCLFDFPDFDDLLPALATTIGGAGALLDRPADGPHPQAGTPVGQDRRRPRQYSAGRAVCCRGHRCRKGPHRGGKCYFPRLLRCRCLH